MLSTVIKRIASLLVNSKYLFIHLKEQISNFIRSVRTALKIILTKNK